MTYEGLRLKWRNKIYIPLTRKIRRRKLKQTSFTIISNNCWGGTVYESYGLQKQSPFVGMFIMPEDYLKLLCNLKYYLSDECRIQLIDPEQSKWRSELENNKNWRTYPVGKLDDIELQLLHYHGTEDEINEQWRRRIERIDWEHMIIKFNDQNGCKQEHVNLFWQLPFSNKLFFSCDPAFKANDGNTKNFIIIKQPMRYKTVMASYEPYGKSRWIDLTAYINDLGDSI